MADRLDLIEERQRARASQFASAVREFVIPRGDERALDLGSGLGALAFALARVVREVVAIELDEKQVARAREIARAEQIENVELLAGDGRRLGLPGACFDLAGTSRTLHHVDRPELVLAELARVTRPGGSILVIDQLSPSDPLEALEIDRFERARDPSHSRALPDVDLRQLFEANELELIRTRTVPETRDLEPYLDLAGCTGDAREQARALAPGGKAPDITVGWYLLRRKPA